jgi:putative FmdB family regulatory protein
MPTYEYICRDCGHAFEELQSMKDDPLVRCPHCHADALARVMGSGTSLIFKGSGFYLTDYKKSGTSPSEANEKEKKTEATDKEKKSGDKKDDHTPPAQPTPGKKE